MIGQTQRAVKEKRNTPEKSSGSIAGLTAEEVKASREKYGTNELTKQPRKTFLSRFIDNFRDPIIKILLGALVLNTVLSIRDINWPENIGIAVAILTATLVSTVSEAGSERAFEKLSETDSGKTYCVRRDCGDVDIPIGEIVVGDTNRAMSFDYPTGEDDWCIRADGNKIFICGQSDGALEVLREGSVKVG